jgi:RHS repeat-associated protein
MGLHSIFAWDDAHSNKHGVNGGGGTNTPNPLYCNTLSAQQQATYPCNAADDHTWSRATLTSRRDQHYRAASSGNVLVDSQITYLYFLAYPLTAQQCPDCTADFSWGNQNDADYLDYYNGQYMGFVQVSEYHPDGSKTGHRYYATEGWGIYNTSKVSCFATYTCHTAPFWHLGTAGHGNEYEASYYATDNPTLLKQDKTQYTLACPPPTVSATPAYSGYGDWDGNRVSGLDHFNPGAVCATLPSQRDTYTFDGGSPGAIPQATTTYSYETNNYQRLTDATTNSNGGGGALGSPTTIKAHTDYIWDDAITATLNDATGRHIVDTPAQRYTADTGNTNHYSCTQTSYDGQGYLTGQQSGLTMGHATTADVYRGCGSSPNFTLSGQIRTTTSFDAYGQQVATKDPDANAGVNGHVGCTVGGVQYTTCLTYDGTYATLQVGAANALNQTTTTGYTSSAAGGFGFWPTSTTDPNGQTTAYGYDALGRPTSTTLPGEGTGLTTTSTVYTVWCTDTGAQAPCVEIDTVQRLDGTHTVTSRGFYDGLGRLVETRTSAPGNQDVVRYAYYDVSARLYFASNPYFVSAYTGAPGAAAFATPDVNQAGTTAAYDALGRTTSVADPLSFQTQTGYAAVCNVVSGDSACYEQVKGIDANLHQSASYIDAWGRLAYEQRYTGNSGGTYALYSTAKTEYDANGRAILITHPDGTTTTAATYDNAGFQLNLTDPDRGSESYSYDQNGNVTQTVDARGASGTIDAGYDGLNRQIWRNSTNSPTGAYATDSYDSTAGGNMGVGRLTGETFNSGASLGAGSYAYTYDARGEKIGWTTTLGGTPYTVSFAYNDAGEPATLTYSDGEVASYGYDGASGALTSFIATPSGGSAQNLVTNVTYSGAGGAAGLPTGANLGGVYTFSAGYDLDLRLTNRTITSSATTFATSPGYDAVGNVTSVATTIQDGTDNQAFCYDEQDRLVWAGSTGTPSCGSSLTSGSLTSAQYTQTFNYDTLDRLTSGPSGSYTYGDGAHKHAATAIGTNTYTASYDASGDMTCRAPTSSQTCSGTPTGQLLTYDNDGRNTAWQYAPSSPTSTEAMAYDGEGNRVALGVTGGTPTYYLGELEEISGGTVTTFLTAGGGLPQSRRWTSSSDPEVLVADGLGSITEVLNPFGNANFEQLFTPYGGSRYSSGSLQTTKAFTGQRADGASGFDYYNARYYDPAAGQFASADTIASGLNRFGYVHGNPTTRVDPSGREDVDPEEYGGGPGGGPSGGPGGGPGPGDPGGGGGGPSVPANVGERPSIPPSAQLSLYDEEQTFNTTPQAEVDVETTTSASGQTAQANDTEETTTSPRTGSPDQQAKIDEANDLRLGTPNPPGSRSPYPAAAGSATTATQPNDIEAVTGGRPYPRGPIPATRYNDANGGGNCRVYRLYAQAYNSGWQGSPIRVYYYQVNGLAPCPSCSSVLQGWANYNLAPIEVYGGGPAGMNVPLIFYPLLLPAPYEP